MKPQVQFKPILFGMVFVYSFYAFPWA